MHTYFQQDIRHSLKIAANPGEDPGELLCCCVLQQQLAHTDWAHRAGSQSLQLSRGESLKSLGYFGKNHNILWPLVLFLKPRSEVRMIIPCRNLFVLYSKIVLI